MTRQPDTGPAAAAGAGRLVLQRGLYFDELDTGTVYAHRPGRTLTEADNVLFSTLTMNPQPLHLDAAYSAGQPFGQRLVNSMLTLAVMVGQSVAQLTQGTLVAQLGLTDVALPHPLFHGDTLYSETLVADKRLSGSRPGQGIVTLAQTGRNQDGTVVATFTRTALMWTEAGHAAAQGRADGTPGSAPTGDGRQRRIRPEQPGRKNAG